jgi:hypothetical protein
MAERMYNLEKSKRMIGMVAMNGLRPRVACFYCITLLIGCCRDPETTMSWCGLFTTNNAEKSKQNSGNAGTSTQQGKLSFRLGQPKSPHL